MTTAANQTEVFRGSAPDRAVLEELAREGLVTIEEGHARTTRKWQSAMLRVIARFVRRGGEEVDVRYVITEALHEFYGPEVTEAELSRAVEAMTLVQLELLHATKVPGA